MVGEVVNVADDKEIVADGEGEFGAALGEFAFIEAVVESVVGECLDSF